MFKRSILMVTLLVGSLAACAQGNGPGNAPATSGAAPAATSAAPAASSAPASTSLTAAAATQETVSTATPGTTAGDTALERIAALPAAATLPAGDWVAGTNYKPLVPAQPTDAPAGKVEVIEVFWYACPHCYALDPYLESWKKNKPAYIEFKRVPIMWSDIHRQHAKLFYTLQALGKEELLHTKVMDTIAQRTNMLGANDAAAGLKLQVDFAKANGISEADYMKAYNSFSVQANLQKAEELGRRYQVAGVPFVIVNGKYTTDVGMAGDQSKLIRIINDLAASEHRH